MFKLGKKANAPLFTKGTEKNFKFVSERFIVHHGLSNEISRFSYDYVDKKRNQVD